MLVSVTPLGARPGRDVGVAVAATVEYLDGKRRQLTREAGRSVAPTQGHDGEPSGAVGYYADSSDQPGVWTGRGVAGVQLRGPVGREQLARMLLGQDPRTGRTLVTRAEPTAAAGGGTVAAAKEWLALKDAARQ